MFAGRADPVRGALARRMSWLIDRAVCCDLDGRRSVSTDPWQGRLAGWGWVAGGVVCLGKPHGFRYPGGCDPFPFSLIPLPWASPLACQALGQVVLP